MAPKPNKPLFAKKNTQKETKNRKKSLKNWDQNLWKNEKIIQELDQDVLILIFSAQKQLNFHEYLVVVLVDRGW